MLINFSFQLDSLKDADKITSLMALLNGTSAVQTSSKPVQQEQQEQQEEAPLVEEETTEDVEKVSVDVLRNLMREKSAQHKLAIKEQLVAYGVKSVSKVPVSKRPEFKSFLESLKVDE